MRDFVHVEDVVKATIARLDAGLTGYQMMNIATGVPVSFRTVAQQAATLVGYKPNITTDTTKPSGVNTRRGDPGLMYSYYTPRITLEQGLCRVLGTL